jgi:hypothetical protein
VAKRLTGFLQRETLDDDPLDFLAAVRARDRQKLNTPDPMSDVDMAAPSSDGSNEVTLALQANLGLEESESGPITPISGASSDVEATDVSTQTLYKSSVC